MLKGLPAQGCLASRAPGGTPCLGPASLCAVSSRVSPRSCEPAALGPMPSVTSSMWHKTELSGWREGGLYLPGTSPTQSETRALSRPTVPRGEGGGAGQSRDVAVSLPTMPHPSALEQVLSPECHKLLRKALASLVRRWTKQAG